MRNSKATRTKGIRPIICRQVCVWLLALAAPFGAFAQSKTIKGVVTDASGDPVAGASVTIKGSSKGIATDANGAFTLEVNSSDKLTISYIGYKKKEVAVGNSTDLAVSLDDDNQLLDEVVVVGYGTQKKATLTGAVSAVSSKEITITKNENVVNMLTGKLPGVRITQLSSRPGAFETKIDIRGLGNPLVVVDGIPRDVDYFARMDANEIESVSVLKDASAAIYGLRSANGVLLVTTKRGTAEAGKFDIQYSANYGWQQFLHVPNNVDALSWMTLVNEKNWRGFNENYMSRRTPIYVDADREPYLTGAKQTTDWLNALFKTTVPQYQHNVTVDGGSDRVNYFFNLAYMNQDGSLRSGSMYYNRWNFRSNIDAKITDRLKAEVSLGGYMDEMNEPRTDVWAIYKNAWTARPTAEIYANGNRDYFNAYRTENNPVAESDYRIAGYNNNVQRVFNGSLALSYRIPGIEGLTAKALYSYNFKYREESTLSKYYYLYTYFPDTDYYEPVMRHGTNGANNFIQKTARPDYKTLMQASLNYVRTFADTHSVNALLLFEEEYSNWNSFYASRESALSPPYLFAGKDNANQKGSMYDVGDRTSQAIVGRLNYEYASKYLIDLAVRYDGSSRFPVGKRYGLFPSVMAGWRVSEEAFIKNNLNCFNNIKLRATYGVTGDDGDAANYPPDIVGYELRPNDLGWYFSGALVGGVDPTAIPNPNLTWYTSKMLNFGIDVEALNGLIGGSIEYFNRNRDGLLETSTALIPGTVGATMPKENLNSDRTFGYEMTLTHRNRVNGIQYYVNAQLSSTRNQWRTKVAENAGNSYDNWRNRENNRYKDIWWGREYVGQFQSYEQIYNHPISIGAGGTVPGDYYYMDWNEDGVINGADDHPIALKGLPWFNYGITAGIEWKGIDASLNFQGASQVYVMYTETLSEPLSFGDAGTMTKFWDRWHPEDPNADIFDPATKWVKGYYPITGSPLAEGTKSIEDASYLRLKTIELGYTLPRKILGRVGIKGIRIYVSGYNMLTFTGLRDMDPEHPGGEGGGASNGIDTYKYPINSTINVGASIKF